MSRATLMLAALLLIVPAHAIRCPVLRQGLTRYGGLLWNHGHDQTAFLRNYGKSGGRPRKFYAAEKPWFRLYPIKSQC
jgi:hypothetical protein